MINRHPLYGGTTSLNCPSSLVLVMRIVNMSSTMLKRRDLKRVSLTKPFICLKKVPNLIIYINCYTPTSDKGFKPFDPLGRKTFHTQCLDQKRPSNLVVGVSKSILKITPFSFFQWSSCIVSCRITTPSRMLCPLMKANWWVGLIMWSGTKITRLVSTFVKIFKTDIGQTDGSILLYLICF